MCRGLLRVTLSSVIPFFLLSASASFAHFEHAPAPCHAHMSLLLCELDCATADWLTSVNASNFRPPDIGHRENVRLPCISGGGSGGRGRGAAMGRRAGEGEADARWRGDPEGAGGGGAPGG